MLDIITPDKMQVLKDNLSFPSYDEVMKNQVQIMLRILKGELDFDHLLTNYMSLREFVRSTKDVQMRVLFGNITNSNFYRNDNSVFIHLQTNQVVTFTNITPYNIEEFLDFELYYNAKLKLSKFNPIDISDILKYVKIVKLLNDCDNKISNISIGFFENNVLYNYLTGKVDYITNYTNISKNDVFKLMISAGLLFDRHKYGALKDTMTQYSRNIGNFYTRISHDWPLYSYDPSGLFKISSEITTLFVQKIIAWPQGVDQSAFYKIRQLNRNELKLASGIEVLKLLESLPKQESLYRMKNLAMVGHLIDDLSPLSFILTKYLVDERSPGHRELKEMMQRAAG